MFSVRSTLYLYGTFFNVMYIYDDGSWRIAYEIVYSKENIDLANDEVDEDDEFF
jgi:hypothetical protein